MSTTGPGAEKRRFLRSALWRIFGRNPGEPRTGEAAGGDEPVSNVNSEQAGPPAVPESFDGAAQLRESVLKVEEQRDQLKTLYYIADELSKSIAPGVIYRRAVELASSVFGARCVFIAGHFHPDARGFHGTVTYMRRSGEIVEHPYPDQAVMDSAPFYNHSIVERWLRGELDSVVRIREEPTVAYPMEMHGRRLGLLLAPARVAAETAEGRPKAVHPKVIQAARQHLAIALEMSELQRERLLQERLAAIGQTVADLSHCLKNTLNGLKGGQFVIERAMKTDNAEKLRRGWRVLTTGIQHIERLTHDMLFYAGDRPLKREPIIPNTILQEVIDLLGESASRAGVTLEADFDEAIQPFPLDRLALYRAILNLVTNAIDACVETETGNRVTLRSRAKPDQITLTIEDNGVGIPRAALRRVTERFFTTKPSKGTGLGLPVVMKIVELHGGTLEVESVVNEGSSFHLLIPRAPKSKTT